MINSAVSRCALRGLAGFALAWVVYGRLERGMIYADPPEVTVHPVYAGQVILVAFKIRNYSLRSVTVVGCEESCGPAGCVEIHDAPVVIPPLGSAEVRVEFRQGAVGKHIKEFPLYLDHPRVPVVFLRVRSMVPSKQRSLEKAFAGAT